MSSNLNKLPWSIRLLIGLLGFASLDLPPASPAQVGGTVSAILRDDASARSRVIIVSDAKATDAYLPKPEPIEAMVRAGLTHLTGQPTPTAAWKSLLSTQDVIGIKVYTSPGLNIGTRKEVTAAVVKGLLEAGMSPTNIVVWDRLMSDLSESGHTDLATTYGIRVESSLAAGYDGGVFYENPLIGKLVYSDLEFGLIGEGLGRKSHLSKLVSKKITRLICISPLLNHNRAGVCGNLYSLATGSMDNMLRFESDAGRLATAIPEICALPELGDRVVLNIVDALICQYQGEHRGLLHYSTALNEVRFSKDPVALDVLSVQELERQRQAAQIKSTPENFSLFEVAALLQIGRNNPGEILIERVP